MKIIVDADACPVKEIIFSVARELQIPVILVSSIAHSMPEEDIAEIRWVDKNPQAADIEIINLSQYQDIIVTGDYGLAALVLGKGSRAISFRGIIYQEKKMDSMLESRYLSRKIRESGGRTKGPKPFVQKDAELFEKSLRHLIELNITEKN